MEAFRIAVAGLAGIVIGSFLNVVIWRVPRGRRVTDGRSRCPACDKTIPWHDNVPVLSWIALRARCRACGASISARYPFVEALTGVLFVLAALRWGDHLTTQAVVSLALAALVAISFIDWDHKIIPDRITKPGIGLALLLAPAVRLHPTAWIAHLPGQPALNAWLHALAGAGVGALAILAIRWVGYLVFRKEAMGLGDVKLLAFVGALVGPVGVLYALVLACFGGAVLGGLRLALARRRPLRFPLDVRGEGWQAAFDAVRIDGDVLVVTADRPAPEGEKARVRLRLPAAGILEDEDATVEAHARVHGGTPSGGSDRWEIRLEDLSEGDRGRLAMMAASYRYVPFGPFLALGGAATLLYGDAVHWLITVGYPDWVRSLVR